MSVSDLTDFEKEATLAHYREMVIRAKGDRRKEDRREGREPRKAQRRQGDRRLMEMKTETISDTFPFSSPEELAVLEAMDHVEAASQELREAMDALDRRNSCDDVKSGEVWPLSPYGGPPSIVELPE